MLFRSRMMESYTIEYDHSRFHPKEEDLKKLEQSFRDAQELEQHTIRCPICGFLKAYVLGEKKGIVRVKCRKCSFDGPMNLAYFRRRRPYRNNIRFEPGRYGPDK